MYTLGIGDKIKLEIRKQGINGEGIGYYNKLAIFVPGAILKEKVNCEIIDIKSTYAMAKLDSLDRASTKRVEPQCKFYDLCGGCQMQHIDYIEQLKIKQSILKQSFRRYASSTDSEDLIKKTLGMKNHYGYRNKAQMPFKNLNFGLGLGLYQPGSNHFVFVDECLVQHPQINVINRQVLTALRHHKVMAFDSLNKEGILLHLVTRYLESTKEASVTFIVTKYHEVLLTVAKELASKNSEIKSITYSVNRRNSSVVFGKSIELLYGEKKISDKVGDLNVAISPDAFHQLNSKQMEVLYQTLLNSVQLTKDMIVVDCYCGIGITSLQLAQKVQKVYGIDYSIASIKDARENANLNHITNTDMIAEHVESALPRLLDEGVKPNIIVLDPPRSGLDQQVIKAIIQSQVDQIVYISCNPSTLAKNIADFLPYYQVKSVQPIDMFPHTSSVEAITVLQKK